MPIFLARMLAFFFEEIFGVGLPFKVYFPLVGVSKRPMIFKRVVFPQPLGPIIMINSPRFTVRSKLCKA